MKEVTKYTKGAGIEIRAEDWPEFRGKGRLGVWNETGLLESFPEDGLRVRWRVPIKAGYSGPAVVDGRVFVTDFEATEGMRGTERALALDEETGAVLWTQEWEADYAGIQWETGPGATPTVDGDRVYVLGRTGVLSALNVETGRVLWRKSYGDDYQVDRMRWGFDWGFASAPLVDGERLICFVGGPPDARVVAFDKRTGEEIWRALPSEADLGVAQPIIIEAAICCWRRDDRCRSGTSRSAAVLFDFLRRADDAHSQSGPPRCNTCLEGE